MGYQPPGADEMLAKPEFLSEPVFSRELYLKQAAHGLTGHFLRATDQPPEVFKQVQIAHEDANSVALKVMVVINGQKFLVVTWTYDLDARGPQGATGREIWIGRSNPATEPVINTSPDAFKEHVFARRVLRVQVEANKSVHQPPGAQIVELRNIGWYVAGLVPPVRTK